MRVAWLIAAGLLASGCAGVAPKVLTSQSFLDEERIALTLFQNAGIKVDDKDLFHFYMRMCNVLDDGQERDCKDSVILENVQP
jgi:thermostable 8-oxoguanine DNA glycosylase